MAVNIYNVLVPLKKSYKVTIGQSITFGPALPITVTSLVYTNNDQVLNEASDFVEMVPLIDQPGATGSYTVTEGTLPAFLALNSTTGRITYTSGTGDLNFSFTVSFTANGGYTGTVSETIRVGVPFEVVSGSQVEIYEKTFTAAEIIAAGTTPILISPNPDTNNLQYFCEILESSGKYKFGTTAFAPQGGSGDIDWGIYNDIASPTLLNQENFGLDMQDTNDRLRSRIDYDATHNIDGPTQPELENNRGDMMLGTPSTLSSQRPVGGDGTIKVRLKYVWIDLENLTDF